MFENMNTHWQNVRRDCGHWPFTQNGIRYTGVYPSEKCSSANKNLIANAKARNPLSIRQVTQHLTQDQTTTLYLRLWENTVLKDIVRDSPECSSVVLSWQLMGQTTSVSSTSATDCCYYLGTTTQIDGIPGVTCTSTGNVTGINWGSQALRNSIPTEIGTLPNLLQLNLSSNQLNGSVPSSLGDLSDLKQLDLGENPLLDGTFRASCQTTDLVVTNTSIILCGCLAASTAATGFAPPGTPHECLAERLSEPDDTFFNSSLTLKKRSFLPTLVFSEPIGAYVYTCHVDSNKNPMQTCLNAMAQICHYSTASKCRNAVDTMFRQMNTWWQSVRRACGRWQWTDGSAGVYPSAACYAANEDLKKNAKYIFKYTFQEKTVYALQDVTYAVTDSMNQRLWGIETLSVAT